MEKSTPHVSLSVVRSLVAKGNVYPTRSALMGASQLGVSFDEIVDILLALTPRDFYKSMTTHNNHRIWQDVYRPFTPIGPVYLKLTVTAQLVIVSFKELQP